ncbi:MAG: hypothetical protein JST62_03525 [Bacteroidetes bacterium]|nr:hypothetical protein [Bacteroidota bacterium]
MEIIMPAEISGKIMTLIDSATEKIIIISPYNKINNWTKLKKRIAEAKNRGILIEWFVRANVPDNNELRKIGVTPIEVENLHCKIYMNESQAVVTSMNLHEFSDSNSIDIGYSINIEKDYAELTKFVNTYVRKGPIKAIEKIETSLPQIPQYDLVCWLKNMYPQYSEKIVEYSNNYGGCLDINDFKKNYTLKFEAMASYFRIDLRIEYRSPQKKIIFDQLREQALFLNNSIGNEIVFGSEMKRLKIYFDNLHSNSYKDWNSEYFNSYIKHRVKKIINTFERVLK